MQPNYKALVESFHKAPGGVDEAKHWLRESFTRGDAKPRDFDIGRLFCECFGWHTFLECRGMGGDRRMVNDVFETSLQEAYGAVSTDAFVAITGQIVFSAVQEKYMAEEFMVSRLVPDKQSQIIGQEKIPAISTIGDEAMIVGEGKPFPLAGVTEDWKLWPEAQKRGLKVALTREVIFADKTGQLIERCSAVGESLGISKENRLTDALVDEGPGAVSGPMGHRYARKGTYISTYADNSGSHDFDNLQATNALVDQTDLDNAEQLFNAMLDPNSNEPIDVQATHLVVTKQLEQTAFRILNSTEVTTVTPGYATSGNPMEAKQANPYRNKYQLLPTRRLATRMATDTSWFLTNIMKFLSYKVIFPFQVIQAPANSYDEFDRDIVRQWRADEMGAAVTEDPRFSVKSTVA